MPDWSSGYVLDIPYTSGFYRELAPTYLQFVLRSESLRAPALGPGSTYCELGCGQGFGTALLAAANPQLRFWGFDFNPAQIANARRLAEDTGLANVTFEDYSFEQAGALPDDALPKFDVIALHGIYAWISPENRRCIVEFIGRRLKPGGLVYVSYNCMPGWAAMAPLQRLFREHADRHPDRSDLQMDGALAFANRLKDAGALCFSANPSLAGHLDKLPTHNRNYLAHEYLNGHWHPLYHLDVAREMEGARLSYACSATIADNIHAAWLPQAARSLVDETRDRAWAETVKDFVCNRQFRRDLFLRGVTPIGLPEQKEALAGLHFALAVPPEAISLKFPSPVGEVVGQEAIYRPIVDALAAQPMTAQALADRPALSGQPWAAIVQALSLLGHGGQVLPAPYDAGGEAGAPARAFNRALVARAMRGEALPYVAAPAAGTGVGASFADLIGLGAVLENPDVTAAEAASAAWTKVEPTGQRMMKDGKALQSREENVQELEVYVRKFFAEKLPIWRQLGVI
jgi:SAM-dependent methyltransferase